MQMYNHDRYGFLYSSVKTSRRARTSWLSYAFPPGDGFWRPFFFCEAARAFRVHTFRLGENGEISFYTWWFMWLPGPSTITKAS